VSSPATISRSVRGRLTCTSGSHELRVHVDGERMRLDVRRLRTLAKVARAARAIGGLPALVSRLPAREVELALRGNVFARKLAGLGGGWRVHPLGLLRALGSRA
jgi:hypothetical protein